MHFLQAINSDLSVLIVCNNTGGTIKGDLKKSSFFIKLIRVVVELRTKRRLDPVVKSILVSVLQGPPLPDKSS